MIHSSAAIGADGNQPVLCPRPVRLLYNALQAQLRSLVAAFATARQVPLTLAAADSESEMSKAFRNRVILSTRETGRRLPLALFRISRNWPSARSISGGIWAVRMNAMLCCARAAAWCFEALSLGCRRRLTV